MTYRRVLLIAALVAVPGPGGAQESPALKCGLRLPSSENRAFVGLPNGDVFCPLVADPKALGSFLSYLKETRKGDSLSTVGSVGIGDAIGIARWGGSTLGNGVQLSLEGAVFAQFDLGTPSQDLVNADYLVGIPLTMRAGKISARLRVYHQSSHLGDEYILRPGDPQRMNLSFESAEGIVSFDANALRLYGGGEYLLNQTPSEIERYVGHFGAELRPRAALLRMPALGTVRFLAAVDVKTPQQQDWEPSVSARAGIELDRPRRGDPPARRWSLLFESYTGPSPYGQFFRQKVQYLGLGAHFRI
jgi:hypothetical protein